MSFYIALYFFFLMPLLSVTAHTGTRDTFQLLTVTFASIHMQTKFSFFVMDNNQSPQAQSEHLRPEKCLF